MKLSSYVATYEGFSAKVSESVRNLSFAGIAVIWIFKKSNLGVNSIPSELTVPTIFFVSTLVFDFLQYLYASVVWYSFYRLKRIKAEKEGEKDPDVHSPKSITNAIWSIWGIKVILLLIGYFYLLDFLILNIKNY